MSQKSRQQLLAVGQQRERIENLQLSWKIFYSKSLLICSLLGFFFSAIWLWQAIKPPSVGYIYNRTSQLEEINDFTTVHIRMAGFQTINSLILICSWLGTIDLFIGHWIRTKLTYYIFMGLSGLQILFMLILICLYIVLIVAAAGTLEVESKKNINENVNLKPSQLMIGSHFYYLYNYRNTNLLRLCNETIDMTQLFDNECVGNYLNYYKNFAIGNGIFMLIFCVISILAKILMIVFAVFMIKSMHTEPLCPLSPTHKSCYTPPNSSRHSFIHAFPNGPSFGRQQEQLIQKPSQYPSGTSWWIRLVMPYTLYMLFIRMSRLFQMLHLDRIALLTRVVNRSIYFCKNLR